MSATTKLAPGDLTCGRCPSACLKWLLVSVCRCWPFPESLTASRRGRILASEVGSRCDPCYLVTMSSGLRLPGLWARAAPLCPRSPEEKGIGPCEREHMSTFQLPLKRYLEACKNDQSCDMTNFGEAGVVYFSPSKGSIKILPTFMGKPNSCVSQNVWTSFLHKKV